MEREEVKKELKQMFPNLKSFIDNTTVCDMCLKWHRKQVENPDLTQLAKEEAERYAITLETETVSQELDIENAFLQGASFIINHLNQKKNGMSI